MRIPNVREKTISSLYGNTKGSFENEENPYYEGNLKDRYNIEYLRGYDYIAENVIPNFFENLDVYDEELGEIGTRLSEKVAEVLKDCLADWIETDRNELVVYMIEKEDEKAELSEETKKVLADD